MAEESVLCTVASAKAAPSSNRRRSPRYRSSRPWRVPVIARPGRQSFEGTIRDFSLKSIGIVADHAVDVGTILILELRSARTGLSCTLRAEVRHATQQADGNWLLGCTLATGLSEEEALAML